MAPRRLLEELLSKEPQKPQVSPLADHLVPMLQALLRLLHANTSATTRDKLCESDEHSSDRCSHCCLVHCCCGLLLIEAQSLPLITILEVRAEE